ncbi:MAG: nuclease [Verrucomicrobia bacterium]|nr:nuclease [Verrucomicrobiota bacterium]
MDVVVDDREPKEGPLRFLRKMPKANVRVARLDVGDYLVDGRLVFERKTFADFATSVCDGRFFRQACNLASATHRPVVILEGNSGGTRISRESLQGAIITLTIILGIPMLRALDAAESARLMHYASRQMCRQVRGAVNRPGYRPKGKRKRQLHILQGLPGIGPTRAERLLETFGSVAGVFAATEEALIAIDGLGTATASQIATTIHEARAEYHVSPRI